MFKNFSLDSLEKLLNESSGFDETGRKLIADIKSKPLDQAFRDVLKNPDTAEPYNKLFPGLAENPTMEGFFDSFGKMINNLNESEDYKDLRLLVQKSLKINRDKIFHSDDPFKMMSDAYGKLGFGDKNQFIHGANTLPNWFEKFTNNYISLDIHGFQEDKVNTKRGRKETFNNTANDAFHSAFSTTCHIYIVNDERSRKKAIKVIEELKLKTLVFNSIEFIDYYDKFLQERARKTELKLLIELVKSEPNSIQESNGAIITSHNAPFFIFDYFNFVRAFYGANKKIDFLLLTQVLPSNKDVIYYSEIVKLSAKLYETLGNDKENFGMVTAEELEKKDWSGRKWEFGFASLRFIRSNGFYQLYYYFTQEDASNN